MPEASETALGVDVSIDVDIVGRQLIEQRVHVGNDLPDDLVQARASAKVARIRHEDERRTVVPFFEQIRSARERSFVERSRELRFAQFAEQVCRHRRIAGAAEGEMPSTATFGRFK